MADLLAADPDFITLHSAVVAAGLGDMLGGPGPITLFAPTDAAFQKIPLEQLQGLQADKAALTSLLLRHVVQGVDLQVRVIDDVFAHLSQVLCLRFFLSRYT